ncbi:MAG: recombinase family protein [Acidobacteriota bacterium]|nr:recombinase family protein [Acidobacteriota bacterium]
MKRACLYVRVSTLDQHPETQLHELRQFASQRGFEIVDEYTDHGVSGTKARRPALDRLLKDAHRHRFDVVLVWSCDRLARSTKHFLQVLDELNDLGIQFLSQREAIDTDGPLGRAIVVIVSAVAELERSLIVERVRAGMRRAKLDGRRIGRAPLDVDRVAIVSDRRTGLSLTVVAKKHGVSRATVCRLVNEVAHYRDQSARIQQQLEVSKSEDGKRAETGGHPRSNASGVHSLPW